MTSVNDIIGIHPQPPHPCGAHFLAEDKAATHSYYIES